MSLSISYSFSPTTTIESAKVNQNFSDIVSYINTTVCVADMVTGWKGAIVDIPTGWVIDNDLKDRMIIGAGNLYAVAATGGEATHKLTGAESGEKGHNHPQDAHAHTVYGNLETASGGGANSMMKTSSGNGNITTVAATATNQAVAASDASSAHNNLPPYYALCYIRKS